MSVSLFCQVVSRRARVVGDAARLGLLASLVAAIAGCGDNGPADPLLRARAAFARQDIEDARSLAASIPEGDAGWADAQVLLGDVERFAGRHDDSLAFYGAVPRDGSPASLKAAQAIGEIDFRKNNLAEGARSLEYVLEHRPDDLKTHARLAFIYNYAGLRARADRHLFALLKKGKLELKDLVALTAPDRHASQKEPLRRSLAGNPRDPFLQLGMALEEFHEQKFDDALARTEEVVQSHPELAEAQALLGELLLDGEIARLEAWHAALPVEVQDDWGVWFVRGLWARRVDQEQVAARCLWEAVRRNPVHRRAVYQLGQTLVAYDSAASQAYLARADQLQECADRIEQTLLHRGQDRHNFERMIALLVAMGREWEAWAWVDQARELIGLTGWLHDLTRSLAHVLKDDPPRFLEDKDLTLQFPLSDRPGFDAMPPSVRSAATASTVAPVSIHFDDLARERGIEFSYFQSPDRRSRGVRIFESTGGGVGVLDFDGDGWPDLYFTQGEEWPPGHDVPAPSNHYRDRLYRNVQTAFADVTETAGLAIDGAYGQGLSCGDYDNDGFVDLYIANIGGNRLWANQGDGTFADVTAAAGIAGAAWTTSCLILDLDGDGDPDLFDVNYLQGERLFSVECEATRCSVRGYAGAPDLALFSRGDGTFAAIGSGAERGDRRGGLDSDKGLGIVAMYVEGDLKPSLFIANDQVPNFFLRSAEGADLLVDQAFTSGLALNRNGQTTASMGVASGDLNHDRRIDLLVTNFEGESSTLFLQRDRGLFEDAIVGSGLMAAGIPYVGWGAQFLDADNDGELDVVVANGHVADFREPGVEYHMPTQLFRNAGQGRFIQQSAASAGELFERRGLGRSIATLDWNRDGRTDFVLSSIESPAALATNRTEKVGHWLDVRLHARTLARDAIGAQVEIRQAQTVHWQQLTAGDGYQATNERQLHFGLASAETIDQLTVHWPGGAVSKFSAVPINATIDIVEGHSAAMLWQSGELRRLNP